MIVRERESREMNPFSNRASDRRSSIPLQLVKDFVAHLNGIWEGTRLEATGSSVTLWIGTNLDCVLKSDSLIVKVRGDGSMILEESDRREFSVTGEIDLATMKVKLTRVIVSKSTDDDDESLSDVITYEGMLHNPWDDDDHDDDDDDDEVLPTCMSLHDRTGAELSLECVTPNAPLPEYEKTKKVPGTKPSLRSATSGSYGSFHFRDTATSSSMDEEEKEDDVGACSPRFSRMSARTLGVAVAVSAIVGNNEPSPPPLPLAAWSRSCRRTVPMRR